MSILLALFAYIFISLVTTLERIPESKNVNILTAFEYIVCLFHIATRNLVSLWLLKKFLLVDEKAVNRKLQRSSQNIIWRYKLTNESWWCNSSLILFFFLRVLSSEFFKNVIGFLWKYFVTSLLKEVTYSLCLGFGFYPKYNRKPGTHFFTWPLDTTLSLFLPHWLLCDFFCCCSYLYNH